MRSITMSRVLLSGALAFGALGATCGFTPGVATAEAARRAHALAGTYISGQWPVPITVSDRGRIESSYSGAEREKGSIKGRVRADWHYSFTMKRTRLFPRDAERNGPQSWRTSRQTYAGKMRRGREGELYLMDDTHRGLTWFR